MPLLERKTMRHRKHVYLTSLSALATDVDAVIPVFVVMFSLRTRCEKSWTSPNVIP